MRRWACAHGLSLFAAGIRARPEDFQVAEKLAIEFSGDGEHDYLKIEKTGANTDWVAKCLARHAGVPFVDVGYAGLKDRHAVTTQWFSLRRGHVVDWTAFDATGVKIVERQVHRRKLRRGAHRGNSFRIALRAADIATHRDAIDARLAAIRRCGVPNYFGPQRFGRNGANLKLAQELFLGARTSRHRRSIALSAARSLLFNEILDARVRAGNWNRLLPGERANLDGSGSVFAVSDVDDELRRRANTLDIHPSATLWGCGAPFSTATAARLETEVVANFRALAEGLQDAGVGADSRALRLRVQDLAWEIDGDRLWLEFFLRRGGFATAVIREIAMTDGV